MHEERLQNDWAEGADRSKAGSGGGGSDKGSGAGGGIGMLQDGAEARHAGTNGRTGGDAGGGVDAAEGEDGNGKLGSDVGEDIHRERADGERGGHGGGVGDGQRWLGRGGPDGRQGDAVGTGLLQALRLGERVRGSGIDPGRGAVATETGEGKTVPGEVQAIGADGPGDVCAIVEQEEGAVIGGDATDLSGPVKERPGREGLGAKLDRDLAGGHRGEDSGEVGVKLRDGIRGRRTQGLVQDQQDASGQGHAGYSMSSGPVGSADGPPMSPWVGEEAAA